MSDYVRKIGIGNPESPYYQERYIKVDSDHVDVAEYVEGETETGSLTEKIHELDQKAPNPATSSDAGIVKPGNGLKMREGVTDGTLDLAYDHTLSIVNQDDESDVLGNFTGEENKTIRVSKVPQRHTDTTPKYGAASSQLYGHVKINYLDMASPKDVDATTAPTIGSVYSAVNGRGDSLDYNALTGDLILKSGDTVLSTKKLTVEKFLDGVTLKEDPGTRIISVNEKVGTWADIQEEILQEGLSENETVYVKDSSERGVYKFLDGNLTKISSFVKTIKNQSIPAGELSLTVSDDSIETTSLIDVYYEQPYSIVPTYTQQKGSFTVTLSEVSSEPINFSVKVVN